MKQITRKTKSWAGECLRKAKFKNKDKAQKSIDRIKEKSGNVLFSYMCPHCLGYHLTKKIDGGMK